MKNQALFSSKDKSKELKCPLLQFLFGASRVKSLSCTEGQTHLQQTSLRLIVTACLVYILLKP